MLDPRRQILPPKVNGSSGKSQRLSYVTVSFRNEIPYLALQARSIARLHEPRDIDKIIIINNDEDFGAFRRAFEVLVRPHYGDMQDRVILADGASIVPGIMGIDGGWLRQQSMKLGVHAMIETEIYIALDSKNHLIRKCSRENYFNKKNQLIMNPRLLWPISENCLDFFGVKPSDRPGVVSNVMTPFPMVTDYVSQTCAAIQEKGFDLSTLFVENPGLFEFALYYAWLVANRHADSYDLRAPFLSAAFWPNAAKPESHLDEVAKSLELARRPHCRWFGVHRRVAQSSAPVHHAIANFWVEMGLFLDQASARSLLAAL